MKLSVITTGILVICAFACTPKKTNREGKLKIVTTTGMIYDAVKNIAGDSVEVNALMGPGVDPHLYKATHGDLEKLNNADLVFYNGLFLEGKMGEVLENLNNVKPTVAISQMVPRDMLIKTNTHGGEYDPHIWFDVKVWSLTLSCIAMNLTEVDPGNKAYYESNLRAYLKRLEQLDRSVEEKIASIPADQRILITAHDAFGYFGKSYDIEVKGLQGISTVSEFGLKDVNELVKMIVERKIAAIFVESSVPTKSIDAVIEGCRKLGHDVVLGGSLYSDAMGEWGTKEGTYVGMFEANVNKMVTALK